MADRKPALGETVYCWDDDDNRRVKGRVHELGDDGFVFVNCVDGVMAEYDAGWLEWDGESWI